jgi:hypothetical protein
MEFRGRIPFLVHQLTWQKEIFPLPISVLPEGHNEWNSAPKVPQGTMRAITVFPLTPECLVSLWAVDGCYWLLSANHPESSTLCHFSAVHHWFFQWLWSRIDDWKYQERDRETVLVEAMVFALGEDW